MNDADIPKRIGILHDPLNKIADIEAKAAAVGGLGARGELQPQKDAIIKKVDELLDEWEKSVASRT